MFAGSQFGGLLLQPAGLPPAARSVVEAVLPLWRRRTNGAGVQLPDTGSQIIPLFPLTVPMHRSGIAIMGRQSPWAFKKLPYMWSIRNLGRSIRGSRFGQIHKPHAKILPLAINPQDYFILSNASLIRVSMKPFKRGKENPTFAALSIHAKLSEGLLELYPVCRPL